MGFGSNYASSYYGKRIDEFVSNWLYGDYNKQKLDQFTALYTIPGIHQYFDYLLDKRADQEYLSRYGMTYEDIHDPRKLKQVRSGSSMISYGNAMVSKNVHRLYGH